ncbi:porin family protein [Chryseobacterium sp. JV558]|uniref:porin family protein n=1 Tax=Chryseobacterium sp. JV558 TaxID=2663236 RepID=UPI00299D128A|nr:porin family protein [Chryseobacterium sp. JV558]MDW9382558.1 outer membrane beta-barrel protein [Chryseobacterium sp. JV558]
MKKHIFFIAAFAFSAIFNAQQNTKDPASMSFGVKGGYSLSNMKFFGTELDSKSYFYAGIVAEQPLSSKLGLQAELLYTQLGGKDAYPWYELVGNEVVNTGNINFDYKFNQIQVPISVKYYIVPELSASVGMNLGFNISSKVKMNTPFGETETHNYESVKTLSLFPFLGAEYKLNEKFFVDARYHFNFIEMNKSNSVPIKIGFLQAGVGYRFK